MLKPLEEIIYDICLDEYSSAEDKIKNIKFAVEDWVLEQEKEKRTPKGMRNQISAFLRYMKEIQRKIDKRECPTPALLPKVYIHDGVDTAFFGSATIIFVVETSCELLQVIKHDYISNIFYEDLNLYARCDELIHKAFADKRREFMATITYPDLVMAKRINADRYNKKHFPFFKEVYNVNDPSDKIERWFNAYPLQQAFKIFGVDSLDFYMTDDYEDNLVAEGYNDYLGNFKLITGFSRFNNAVSKYIKDTGERRARIEASRKEHDDLVNNVVTKGKAGKIKFVRLEIPDMPTDDDLPF